MIVNKEEIKRFVDAYNKANEESEPLSGPTLQKYIVQFLGVLNGYLFVLNRCGLRKRQYNLIREALQDITNMFVVGLDIETFGIQEGEFYSEDYNLIKIKE